MNVCLFGTFDRTFPRNYLAVEGLEKAGVGLTWCHIPTWEKFPGGKRHGSFFNPLNIFRVLFALLASYLSLFRRLVRTRDVDIYLVGYPGHLDVIVLKLFLTLLRRRQPVALILLITLYDTIFLDRRLFKENDIRCRAARLIDRLALRASDLVITDSEEYRNFLQRTYEIKMEKTRSLYIGADSGVFAPVKASESENARFEVLFFGMFIPLHGLETMVRAAKLLEHRKDIHFTFYGTGQLKEDIEILVTELDLTEETASFPGWIPQEEIPQKIAESDLCLGIFGDSIKAGIVIPNKAFQVIGMAKPFITRESPAIKELFTHGENAYLVPTGDPESLADGIEWLEADRKLCETLGNNGRKLFLERCSQEAIGLNLRDLLIDIADKKTSG